MSSADQFFLYVLISTTLLFQAATVWEAEEIVEFLEAWKTLLEALKSFCSGRHHCTSLAAPRHHDRVTSETTLQNLVPTNDIATTLSEELLNLAVDIGLQLILNSVLAVIHQAKLLSLTLWTRLPAVFRTLATIIPKNPKPTAVD